MTRTADLSERIKVTLPYAKVVDRPPIPIRAVHASKPFTTVGELFEQIDMGEFISAGGSLSNNIGYDQLKDLFKTDITIEEAATLLNSGGQNANKKDCDRSTDTSSLKVDEDGNLKE